jgi:hypothetical protein
MRSASIEAPRWPALPGDPLTRPASFPVDTPNPVVCWSPSAFDRLAARFAVQLGFGQ